MATITIINNPGTYSPVYDYITATIDSASSSVSDFKYLYYVYKVDMATGITSSLNTYPVPPRPVTGYGIINFNDALRSEMTYDLQPFISTGYGASHSIVKYFYRYGYESTYTAPILGVLYILPNVVFYFPASFNDFQVGDIINVTMDNQSINPQYNGSCTVLSANIFGLFYIVEVDIPAPSSPGVSETGEVTRLERPFSGTSSTYYAFNGTRQYEQPLSDPYFNWSNTHTFYPNFDIVSSLTNYKSGLSSLDPIISTTGSNTKKIFANQYETLDIIVDNPSVTSPYPYQITWNNYATSATSSITSTYSYPLSSVLPVTSYGGWKRYIIPVGTTGSSLYTATGPYYSVRIDMIVGDEPPVTLHNKMIHYYEIVKNCTPNLTNYRIAWMNPHGGFDYWNFNYKSIERQSTSRNEYRKLLPYDWTIGDRGDEVYSVKSNKSFNITTDFLDEYDNKFLFELTRSQRAYLIDEKNKKIYPIMIDKPSDEWNVDPGQWEQFVSLDFRMAYDKVIQRG